MQEWEVRPHCFSRGSTWTHQVQTPGYLYLFSLPPATLQHGRENTFKRAYTSFLHSQTLPTLLITWLTLLRKQKCIVSLRNYDHQLNAHREGLLIDTWEHSWFSYLQLYLAFWPAMSLKILILASFVFYGLRTGSMNLYYEINVHFYIVSHSGCF